MEAIASKLGDGVKRASGVGYESYSFGSEGYEPAVVGVVASLEKGKITSPVAGTQGVYILQAENVSPNSNARPLDVKQAREELSRRASYDAYGALEQMSTIEDRRGKFY